MTAENKLPLTSSNVTAEVLAKLREIAPQVFTEGGVDFDKLKATLGENIVPKDERYGLSWAGKSEAFRNVQIPSVGTLLPQAEESVNFDTSENLIIEGDNLEVLKLLQKSYHGKVKMIYIDPPYNTGNEFIYPDNYHEGLDDYLKYSGQVTEEGQRRSSDTETSGRYHSKWLNMIYPRLFLARNLLRDDGVIVIHIDEHEQENLLLVLNEIFGDENNLGTIVWDKKNPKGDATGIAYQHESILVFARNREGLALSHELVRKKANAETIIGQASAIWAKNGTQGLPIDLAAILEKYQLDKSRFKDAEVSFDKAKIEELFASWVAQQDYLSGGEAAYNKLDEHGEVYRLVHMGWPNKKKAPDEYFIPLIHPMTGKACPVPERGWRNPPETMKKYLSSGEIVFGSDDSVQPQRKYLLKKNMTENIPSILRYGGSDDALFKELKLVFDNPKPYRFAADLVAYFTHGEDDIVLDFFAGSGTSGHAVMEANKRDGKSRRFILVQLPEPVDGTKQTIADICKERIKRVGTKYDSPQSAFGFKSFKLTSSNFKIWNADTTSTDAGGIGEQLRLYADNVERERTQQDILYELVLKSGLPLSAKVERIEVAGKPVYSIAQGQLLICLENEIGQAVLRGMIALTPIQMVCLDRAFGGNDQMKTNTVLEAKSQDVTFRTV